MPYGPSKRSSADIAGYALRATIARRRTANRFSASAVLTGFASLGALFAAPPSAPLLCISLLAGFAFTAFGAACVAQFGE